MAKFGDVSAIVLASGIGALIASPVLAENFNIPSGTLSAALDEYAAQTGMPIAATTKSLSGVRTKGVSGEMSPDEALTQLLSGTGFAVHHVGSTLAIVRSSAARSENVQQPVENIQLAQAKAPAPALETVTVTSSKLGGADVQSIPISITALSQEQLTATQTAGGPDLIKQVPNMTFSKTNFSGYTIQLRGIGTQAISVTTDPAVAVAFNDMPFLRNHFFEQEFYDVSQVEVLRGPQGTLYGRNATAGVVNLVSAKPTDQFEALASADLGNYHSRRFEGMINLPIVDDRVDLRIAGEWTKRQGYSFDTVTNERIDGRDLWSGRITLGFKPTSNLQTYFVWEHFSEDDDRLRSSKQLCKTAPIPAAVDGVAVPPIGSVGSLGGAFDPAGYVTQGCQMGSLYSSDAFEVPNGYSLQYVKAAKLVGGIVPTIDPYAETTQSQNLREIESELPSHYAAKNDVVQFNADYAITPSLTFTSQSGFNHDFLYSTEDYNRFDTTPGIFINGLFSGGATFCDPQLGCSTRLLAQDVSDEHAWQANQEFRLTSNLAGPFNFSAGGNYMHYETEENYYVFINALSVFAVNPTGIPGNIDNSCLTSGGSTGRGYQYPDPSHQTGSAQQNQCVGIDFNSLSNVNNQGHNYFLSQNPYTLNSYAMFGEAYYNIVDTLKLTTGLRWTEDQKHFVDIPSETVTNGYGYLATGVVNQQWDQFTGRAALNWTPKLNFTDQTLFYGSYAHGYKAGGANPPGAIFDGTVPVQPIHPLTFKPEFIDAFELGSKNTLLDGSLTLNADIFYYNYEHYQISEIVDRTAINLNFDTHVKGAELESTWEPTPGLRFNFAGGWESTALAKGSKSIDLIDRTDAANHPDWIVVKPFPTLASNCILPTYVVAAILNTSSADNGQQAAIQFSCTTAYSGQFGGVPTDPVTYSPYVPNPSAGANGNPIPPNYPGFNPLSAPNDGEGFDKNLSGNELPNAPPLTVSAGAQYTIPLTTDWAGTLRGDYYWQDYSWARVFNDNPYDRLRGYTTVNLSLIFTSQNGWQVMLYDKNVFNTTAITGDFLNSDDSGLTTNIFLTDPKLIGIRVTKNW